MTPVIPPGMPQLVYPCNQRRAINSALDFEKQDESYAVISITTPGFPHPAFNTPHQLQLKFHDADQYRYPEHERAKMIAGLRLFDAEQAKMIWLFAYFAIEVGVQYILTHCDSGISRSPAVVAALHEKFYGREIAYYFRQYSPNRWVYRMMVNTYADVFPRGR